MTECIGSPAQEMAEQYLAGGLPESEAERFENHYFGCDECHGYVLALQEIRDGLAREPIAIAPAPVLVPVASRQTFRGRVLAFPVPMAVLGSIAAALIFGYILVRVQRSEPILQPGHSAKAAIAAAKRQPPVSSETQPKTAGASDALAKSEAKSVSEAGNTELALLADMHLPGYQQPQLRGEEASAQALAAFSTGMQAYAKGDCEKTLQSLREVPGTSAKGVAARLYSGLCEFKGQQLDQAQADFAKVVAAGDTPQLETAEYFLAQSRLLRGDEAGAASWLNKTIALHGDYEEWAQKQETLLPH